MELVVNMSDNKIYSSIMTGLNEALEDVQNAKYVNVTEEPAKLYKADAELITNPTFVKNVKTK